MSDEKLPHEAQHIDVMQRRYTAALDDLYDHRDPTSTGPNRPSQKRRHVFDFDDGLRLIVSRERREDGEVGIHVSASIDRGMLYTRFVEMQPENAQREFRRLVEQRWRQLAGAAADARIPFLGWTVGKGVPHWWIRQ